MKPVPVLSTAFLFSLAAVPAFAQGSPPSPLIVSGLATMASDDRPRGVSRTGKEMAAPGGVMIAQDDMGSIANGAVVASLNASF